MTVARLKRMLTAVLAAGVLAACGGGGGGGGGGNATPTSAVMTVYSTAVTATAYATSGIGGVGLSILMPAGVSVSSTSGNVDAVASGVALGKASVIAVYSAATGTFPGTLAIVSASTVSAGFGVGEFLTVNFIVSAGTPTAGSFSISDFTPVNTTNYAPIAGLASGFTVDVK